MRKEKFSPHSVARYVSGFLEIVNEKTVLIAILLSGLFLAAAIKRDLSRPYWLDELLGLAATKVPTWSSIMHALGYGVDFNPPLYHIAARAMMLLLGPSALAFRLPATVGFLTFMVCIFVFTSKRLPLVFGLLALMVPVCTSVRTFAWDGRPYGLLLGFLGLALVAWQAATDGRKRLLSIPSLSAFLGAAIATHYYGILLLLPFAVAETGRSWQKRRIDWPIATSLLIPCCVPLLLIKLIMTQRTYLQHYHSPGVTLFEVLSVYRDFSIEPTILLIIAALSILAGFAPNGWRKEVLQSGTNGFRQYEILLMVGLLALPGVGFLTKTVTHAYVGRYFAGAVGGISLIFAAAIFCISNRQPLVTLITVVMLGSYMCLDCGYGLLRSTPDASTPFAELVQVEMPVLMEDLSDCLLADHYWPSSRTKPWCLADRNESLRLQGWDSDEVILLALKRLQGLQVDNLEHFTKVHPEFLLVRSERGFGWGFKKLVQSRAQMTVSHPFTGARIVYDVVSSARDIPGTPQNGEGAPDR